MYVTRVVLLLLVIFWADALKVSSKDVTFTSKTLETHLIFKKDSSLSNDGMVISAVTLTGSGAPSKVSVSEVVKVNGGSISIVASEISGGETGEVNGQSARLPSIFMLVAILSLVAGPKLNLPFTVVAFALLCGSAFALQSLNPTWVLTVTISVPSDYKLNSLNVDIGKGSIKTDSNMGTSVSNLKIDLCSSSGNQVSLDGFALKTSAVCASKEARLNSISISDGSQIEVNSTEGAAFVFVKDSYAGAFNMNSRNGTALALTCSSPIFSESTHKSIIGHCGSQKLGISVNAQLDAIVSLAEDVTATGAQRWSDAKTWGGKIPADGDDVVISKDQIILIDTTTASLGKLDVRGSLIADPAANFVITADSINVYGTLRVGWLSAPYTKNGRFNLTGAKTEYASRAPLNAFSNDGVSRGFRCHNSSNIHLHGSPPKTVYTRLNDHAKNGSVELVVDSVAGWAVNDEIAISPTTYPSTSSTDYRVIKSIDAVNNKVTIDRGLSYARFGKLQYATDSGISYTPGVYNTMRAHPDVPDHVDERAVIVHLTRNIVIEGANDTHWSNGHGVHFMWMGSGTIAQINGVEVRRAGQAGALGRYAVHSHMQSYNMPYGYNAPALSDGRFEGDASLTFVRNVAVHQSVNRGLVIHGTCGARFINNVVTDILGHAIFIEDGSEIRNIIVGNVALHVAAPASQNVILGTDTNAAGVWMSQPNNYFANNIVGDIRNGHGLWNAFSTRMTDPQYMMVSKPDSVTFVPNLGGWRGKYLPRPLENWTLTAVNETSWSVVGSRSGAQPNYATYDQDYGGNHVFFKLSGSAPAGSEIKFYIETYGGGCFGQSRYVELWPMYTPTAFYFNNTAFACAGNGALSDQFATDELGNRGSSNFPTFNDSLPGGEWENTDRRVSTVFRGHRLWMNEGGGYSNRVLQPLYLGWTLADNRYTDLSGAVFDGIVANSLFIGNSLNNLESQLYAVAKHALASYHFGLGFHNLTFYNYPPLPEDAKYTERFLVEVPGILMSWDLYLGTIEKVGPKNKLKNWRQFNVTQFERCPPPQIEYLYNDSSHVGSEGPYGFRRYWTFSGALYDHEGALAGVPGDYLTFNHPFYTYNLKNKRIVGRPDKSTTIATSEKMGGMRLSGTDDEGSALVAKALTYVRLDSNFNDVANFTLGDASKSWMLGNMHHVGIFRGGIYRIFHQDDNRAWSKQCDMEIDEFGEPDDHFILGLPWSGAVEPTVTFNYDANRTIKLNSRDEMVAQNGSYWVDAPNNMIWYHHTGAKLPWGDQGRLFIRNKQN